MIINITTDYIKLDQLLKYAGLVGSGTDAKFLIQNQYVSVNDMICEQRGKKIYPDDIVLIKYDTIDESLIIKKGRD